MKKYMIKYQTNLIFPLLLVVLATISWACKDDDITDDDIAGDDCTDVSAFAINLNPDDCTVDIEASLGVSSQYEVPWYYLKYLSPYLASGSCYLKGGYHDQVHPLSVVGDLWYQAVRYLRPD